MNSQRTASEQPVNTFNNNNNKRTKEHNNNTIAKHEKIKNDTLLDIPDQWKDIFNLWLEYKNNRKEQYSSSKYALIAYKHLVELSGNDSQKAEKIIQQSIANNWAGLFELKNKGENKNAGNTATNKFTGTLNAAREIFAEMDNSQSN